MGIYHLKCQICKNEWDPTRRELPRRCPNCHSDKWGSGSWTLPKLDLSIKGKIDPVNRKLNLSEKRPLDKRPDRQSKRYGHNTGGRDHYKVEDN
jgi:hypothetical protein